MQYVFQAGINPQTQLTELALMRLAIAVRAAVGFSKKVVFKVMKELKNKALWVCYTVDGVKCSTFVSAVKFANLLVKATSDLNQVKADYIKTLQCKFSTVTLELDAQQIVVKIGTKNYYISSNLSTNMWDCYTSKNQSIPRLKSSSLPTLITNLINTSIFN